MKFLPAGSVMVQPSRDPAGTRRMRQYPAASIGWQNLPLLIEYERIAAEVTRTAELYFSNQGLSEVQMRSGTLVEMCAPFVDRGEPHHAFGHLSLNRAVRIQRVRHSIDHARFENRNRRLVFVARGRRLALCAGCVGTTCLGKGRWRPAASPRRRIGGSGAFRLWPGVLERRARPLT